MRFLSFSTTLSLVILVIVVSTNNVGAAVLTFSSTSSGATGDDGVGAHTYTFQLPLFDSSLGTLAEVRLDITADAFSRTTHELNLPLLDDLSYAGLPAPEAELSRSASLSSTLPFAPGTTFSNFGVAFAIRDEIVDISQLTYHADARIALSASTVVSGASDVSSFEGTAGDSVLLSGVIEQGFPLADDGFYGTLDFFSFDEYTGYSDASITVVYTFQPATVPEPSSFFAFTALGICVAGGTCLRKWCRKPD